MELRFATRTLEQCFRDECYAAERWGATLASRYTYVVNFLACIDAARDLGRFAFLGAAASPDTARGPRWTVCLVDRWRLVLELAEGGNAIGIIEVGQS